jgi:kinase-associated protein B
MGFMHEMYSGENAPQIGDRVKVKVRSGEYAGEIAELNGPRAVVSILAVLKHPEQGDLHHPYNPDVPMFHERRALSYTEKTTVLVRELAPYRSELPAYSDSLREAVKSELASLDRLNRWSGKALENLEQLQKEYKL